MTSATWIDELAEEFRYQETERAAREARQHVRLMLLQELGPLFFDELRSKVQAGVTALTAREAGLKALTFDLPNGNNAFFSVRNYELRPMVRSTASFNTVGMILNVETRQSATDPFRQSKGHRIDFGLDSNNRLSLCMECSGLNVDDVAKLILRPVLGL